MYYVFTPCFNTVQLFESVIGDCSFFVNTNAFTAASSPALNNVTFPADIASNVSDLTGSFEYGMTT